MTDTPFNSAYPRFMPRSFAVGVAAARAIEGRRGDFYQL